MGNRVTTGGRHPGCRSPPLAPSTPRMRAYFRVRVSLASANSSSDFRPVTSRPSTAQLRMRYGGQLRRRFETNSTNCFAAANRQIHIQWAVALLNSTLTGPRRSADEQRRYRCRWTPIDRSGADDGRGCHQGSCLERPQGRSLSGRRFHTSRLKHARLAKTCSSSSSCGGGGGGGGADEDDFGRRVATYRFGVKSVCQLLLCRFRRNFMRECCMGLREFDKMRTRAPTIDMDITNICVCISMAPTVINNLNHSNRETRNRFMLNERTLTATSGDPPTHHSTHHVTHSVVVECMAEATASDVNISRPMVRLLWQ
jgi:hypothetical protein